MLDILASKPRQILSYGGIWLLWATFCAFGIQHFYGQSWTQAMLDSIISNALLVCSGILVLSMLTYYHPVRGRYAFTFLCAAVLAVAWLLFDRWLLGLLPADTGYASFLSQSLPVRFLLAYLFNSQFCIAGQLWFQLHEQHETQQRKEEYDRMGREAELFKLRQQLQPHFLFNSLNSINALIRLRPDEARSMVQKLSDFLRGTLKREDLALITLEEELDHVRLYLDIERQRFGQRLELQWQVHADATQAVLPPLILQPLVENAIKFGLYGTTGPVSIRIEARIHAAELYIQVSNPFDRDMQGPPGTGFGLRSVERRLYLLFGRSDLLRVRSMEGQFDVGLTIPQYHAQRTAD